jgi:hypothetical protein
LGVSSIASIIENFLKLEGLSFQKIKEYETIVFKKIKIGDDFTINISDNLVVVKISLTNQKDIKTMKQLISKFVEQYENIDFSILDHNKIIDFKIIMNPYNIKTFKEIFFDLSFEFQNEISPFMLGVVTEKPREFLLKQYQIWKSIPDDEKAKVVEQILIMKESCFRNVKTESGIIKKLNKIKKEISSSFGKDIDIEPQENDQIIAEFYFLDFAAMLRAVELGLIKLRLSDFFEDFHLRKEK